MKLDSYALRAVGKDDEALLRELFVADREPVLLSVQYAGRQSSWAVQWPHAEDSIIEVGGDAVGRVLVNRTEQLWWVVDVAVLPERRREGIGARVLRDLIEGASRSGARLGLRVDRGNPASGLYERLGLRVVSEDSLHFVMQTDATQETS